MAQICKKMEVNNIAIIGHGGFGRELYYHMLNDGYHKTNIKFYVDEQFADNKNTFPITKISKDEHVIVAIGDPASRQKVVQSLPSDTNFFTFIHSSVIILDEQIKNNIGRGSIICAGCVLTTSIKIGEHSQLNLHTTIGHDCIIQDYFTSAPGVNISGNCTISDRVYFGTNSCTKQKLNICSDVTIGMNAAVTKDITESGIYVGIPAKKI